jgi:hypothetical protein
VGLARVGPGKVISVGRNKWSELLLALPFMGLICGPLYAARSPEVFGLSFFYPYELACVLAAAALSWFVYRAPARSQARAPCPMTVPLRIERRKEPEEEPRFTRDPVPTRVRVRG